MLNQENIDLVENCIALSSRSPKFITNENPRFPSISYRYYDNALQIYNMLKTEPVNSYEIFASNGMGYQSFGMYKANNEKIYIVEARMNSLSYVYEIGSKMKEMIPEQA
jgi:hypothetical protein